VEEGGTGGEWGSEGIEVVESESPPRSNRREGEAGVGLQFLKGLEQVRMRLVRGSAEEA
jgi:hypothetical protein